MMMMNVVNGNRAITLNYQSCERVLSVELIKTVLYGILMNCKGLRKDGLV